MGECVIEAKGGVGVISTPIKEFTQRYSHIERRYLPGDINKVKVLMGQDFNDFGIWCLLLNLNMSNIEKAFCSELVAIASHAIRDEDAHKIPPEFLYILSSKIND
jgi:hypothetical protein